MAVKKKFALGRGLDALIQTDNTQTDGASSISEVDLDKIQVNPIQPRRDFDQDLLRELADSIKEIGIVQPITLRKLDNDRYQIIAGERRFRASKMAGLSSIPAYIRTVDDENMMEMALVENIQREDLNSLEIALAYKHLMDEYEMTQEKVSERVGKSRATVANYLRLLRLPGKVQMGLKEGRIDMGHARALLATDNPTIQNKIYEETLREGHSVRKVEELVREYSGKEDKAAPRKNKTAVRQEYRSLESHLSGFFGTRVKLSCGSSGKGSINIPFKSEEELERIMRMFDTIKNEDE